MKIRKFCFILFFLVASSAKCQRFNAGVLVGFSGTQVDGDGYSGFNKLGGIFGGFVNRELSEYLVAQMEIKYTGKGSRKVAEPEKNDFTYYHIFLHYIDVPVIVKINHKKFRLTYDIGLSYGRLISSAEEGDNVYKPLAPFHKDELAGIIGFDFSITEKFSFDFRYVRSILPITDTFIVQAWGVHGGSYNSVIEITMRYQFFGMD